MKKYFEVLRKCSLFNDIADDDISAMLGCFGATVRHFNRRETVIAEGEPAKCVGIVLSGAVQIEQTDYFGNRSIVASVAPAEMFGESFACAGDKTMPVDVVAAEGADIMLIDCMRITQPCCKYCSFHQQIVYNLMKAIAAKNLVLRQKIQITSKRSTREKLMAYLLILAKKNNSSSFKIPYDRQELADYLEVDRSGLSAEISKLRKEGIIENQKNYFVLREAEEGDNER